MVNSVVLYFLSLFSVYGIICLVKEIYSHFREKKYDNKGDVKIILAVQNKEEDIERIVRNLIEENYQNNMGSITVVDRDSQDDTLKILESLMKEYRYLNVLSTQEIIEKIKRYSLN